MSAPGPSETYTFVANPQPINRRKYRDPSELQDELAETANIMWDPRVIRGTNSGRPIQTMRLQEEFDPDAARQERIANRRAARTLKRQLVHSGAIRPTFRSVKQIHDTIKVHKKRVEVPLHLYLIEQSEPTASFTAETQTDVFLKESPAPPYVPRKTGVDTATQVENARVFNFDREVSPILEVVISKTLEQSLMEIREEEELKAMSEHKQLMIEREEREEIERKLRLQEERDRFARKMRRVAEARKRADAEQLIREKIAANAVSRKFLERLEENSFDTLYKKEFFFDPLERQVEAFMPWLYAQVDSKLTQVETSRKMVEDIMSNAILSMAESKRKVEEDKEAQKRRRAQIAKLKASWIEEMGKKKMKIQLYIHTNILNPPVGPINLTAEATVGEVEDKVLEWMIEHLDAEELGIASGRAGRDDLDDFDDENGDGEFDEKERGPIARERISFLWSGKRLKKDCVLYDLGVENLSTITMHVEPLPEPEEDDEDEDEDEEYDEDGNLITRRANDQDEEEEGEY